MGGKGRNVCGHLVDPRTVTDLLVSIPRMRTDILAAALISELDPGHIAAHEFIDPASDPFDLVRKYLAVVGGPQALLRATRKLYRGAPQVEEISRLLSLAAPFLSQHDERRIRELLQQCDIENLATIYHLATGGATRLYPPGLADIWDVFYYLLDSNSRPGHLAPHLHLVALVIRDLVHRQPPTASRLVVELRRWMYQQCDELRDSGDSAAAAKLDLLLRQPPPYQTRSDHPIGLIIQIVPLPAPNDDRNLHLVSHWRQVDHVRWHPVRGEDRQLPMEDVPRHVLELIEQAEDGWGYGVKGPLVLEFILPAELINLDIDQWPQQREGSIAPENLGSDYEIVVRCDATLRPKRKHKPWHLRWEAFMLGHGEAHLVPLKQPVDLNDLRDKLKHAPHLVTCVLSTPPDQEPGRSELQVAVDAGIPAILWCRNVNINGAFRTTITDALQPPKLRQLPLTIKDLRSSARTICGNVALLWDDPNHVIPGLDPLRTPSG
jgi:hypothetical protein